MDTVELKFREKGQQTEWEDLPVMLLASKGEIDKSIDWLRRMFRCVDIRWNFTGSYQGFYVKGSVSRY